jgi:putative nucleotidyltransferase with HDIG domain
MSSEKTTMRIFFALESLALLGAITAAVLLSHATEWQPLLLVLLLAALSVVGDGVGVTIRGQHLSSGFVAQVLAMSLLGPAPAVAIALTSEIVVSFRRRVTPLHWLGNMCNYATFPLVGGLMIGWLVGDVHAAHNETLRSVYFSLTVFGVFMVTNTLNFSVVALDNWVLENRRLLNQVRELYVPMLPGQLAAGALTGILAVAYTSLGLYALLGAVLAILIFQYLVMALLRSEERADQLEARSIHLASLQLGVLAALVETLALRDRSVARHAAAVARYSRELAREAGCDESEQDLVHTAGLLHDIGKFALPDHILHAEILSDDDWALIRRHPQDGATLVGRLDGYGPVAEAILYHHEKVDGSGYPAGLIGSEIPMASRILAIASTYDSMTARDTYRSPVNPKDAVTELRRVAGRQLDSELVETFVAMLERDGRMASIQADEADFEAELAFGRRAQQMGASH